MSKQESDINMFFARGRHDKIDIYYESQSYFHLSESTIRNNCNIILLYKQTLGDIIPLFDDIAGLDMNLEEWKQLCHIAWENEYDYLQTKRLAKIGGGKYTIRNCIKTIFVEYMP